MEKLSGLFLIKIRLKNSLIVNRKSLFQVGIHKFLILAFLLNNS
jgi:hypothetical protein